MRSFYLTVLAALVAVPAAAQSTDRRIRIELSHPAAGQPAVRGTAALVWRDAVSGAELGRSGAGATAVLSAGRETAASWVGPGGASSASAAVLRVEAADGTSLTLEWDRLRRVYPGALEFTSIGRAL